MSIDKKLIFAAENQERVYEAGKGAERDRFWDEFQQNGQRRNYNLAFGGEYWDDERIKKMKYPLNVGQLYAYMMFARSNVVDLADALGDEMLVLSGPQYAFTLCNKLERVGRLECCNY